jgi:hypothetical protein
VTLATNCDIFHGSTVTISGLTGSQTPDAGSATVEAALALNTTNSVFHGGQSTWTQISGVLTMTVNLPNAHWMAQAQAVISFTLKNALLGQVTTPHT